MQIADVAFILDDSGSINYNDRDNWQRDALGFVSALIRRFAISQIHVRIGVVKFSNYASLQFRFDRYTNISTLLPAVRAIEYDGGETNIADGLRKARTGLFNITFSPNSQKIAILVTDGRPNVDESNTLVEATNLKNAGVEIFTVGIGSVDEVELKKIASSPDQMHNYLVKYGRARYNYAHLDTILQRLSTVICTFGVSTTVRPSSTTSFANPESSISTPSGSPVTPISTTPGPPTVNVSTPTGSPVTPVSTSPGTPLSSLSSPSGSPVTPISTTPGPPTDTISTLSGSPLTLVSTSPGTPVTSVTIPSGSPLTPSSPTPGTRVSTDSDSTFGGSRTSIPFTIPDPGK